MVIRYVHYGLGMEWVEPSFGAREMYAKQAMIYAVINVHSQYYLEQFFLGRGNWFI